MAMVCCARGENGSADSGASSNGAASGDPIAQGPLPEIRHGTGCPDSIHAVFNGCIPIPEATLADGQRVKGSACGFLDGAATERNYLL